MLLASLIDEIPMRCQFCTVVFFSPYNECMETIFANTMVEPCFHLSNHMQCKYFIPLFLYFCMTNVTTVKQRDLRRTASIYAP